MSDLVRRETTHVDPISVVHKRLDDLSDKLDQGFDTLARDTRGVLRELGAIGETLVSVRKQIDELRVAVQRLESADRTLTNELVEVKRRIDDHEHRFRQLEDQAQRDRVIGQSLLVRPTVAVIAGMVLLFVLANAVVMGVLLRWLGR